MAADETIQEPKAAPASTNGASEAAQPEEPRRKVRDIPRVHTWPHLLRMELLCALVIMVLMVVWSIAIDAPLEEPANPTLTPNPSKAPWYFLGLQEMLVYFDPWMAGVVLPSLIIVGLMAIPYIDVNPRGNGYYTWRERPFAMVNFFVGFWILWIMLIIEGVFLRGPGWNFFLPWQEWDPRKVVALTNVDFHEFFGLRNPVVIGLVGAIPIALYYGLGVLYWRLKKDKSPALKELGLPRYALTAFLFLTMWLLPIKMVLRYTLNLKYLWVTPWFNI